MSNTPHTLHDEFPGAEQKLSMLKTANAHFARLLEDYDRLNDQVHRAETRIDAISEQAETDLRRKRAQVKDEIARLLRAG